MLKIKLKNFKIKLSLAKQNFNQYHLN